MRNSFSLLAPIVVTTWPATEPIASRKSVACSGDTRLPELLYGASLAKRIQRIVARFAGFTCMSDLAMKNFAVCTLGTKAGCCFKPMAAAFAGVIVIGLFDDRSRRVCSQPT